MTKANLAYISDILQAITLIEKYTLNRTVIDLASDIMLQDSVIRRVEIIGVAANKVSEDIKQKYPDIPWREIIDTRNRISHDYDAIDIDLVWDIAQIDLPNLKDQLQQIINDLTNN